MNEKFPKILPDDFFIFHKALVQCLGKKKQETNGVYFSSKEKLPIRKDFTLNIITEKRIVW